MILIAFDNDGTIKETGNPPGPISIKRIRELKNFGLTVGIVGNWAPVKDRCSHLDFYLGSPKMENLMKLRRQYECVLYIYVADTQDDEEAAVKAGFSFIRSENFR